MNTNDHDKVFSSGVFIALIIITGFIATLILSMNFDPTCGVDQCRYVDITDAKLFYDLHPEFSATKFIFEFYTLAQESDIQYVVAFLTNIVLIAFVIFIVGIDYSRNNLLIPFIIPYAFLAGKEIFIILGLFCCFASLNYKSNLLYKSFVMFLGLFLIFIARYQFIAVFLFMAVMYPFVMNGRNFRKVFFSISGLILLTIPMMVMRDNYQPSPSLYEPSSIPFVLELRILTSGFGLVESFMRFFLYFIYSLMSPFIELTRFLFMKSISPSILISISSIIMPIFIYRKFGLGYMINALVLVSLSLAPIFGFVHTRYLLPLMYFFYMYKVTVKDK